MSIDDDITAAVKRGIERGLDAQTAAIVAAIAGMQAAIVAAINGLRAAIEPFPTAVLITEPGPLPAGCRGLSATDRDGRVKVRMSDGAVVDVKLGNYQMVGCFAEILDLYEDNSDRSGYGAEGVIAWV